MKKYFEPEFRVIKYVVNDKTLDGYKPGDTVDMPWDDDFESYDGNDNVDFPGK